MTTQDITHKDIAILIFSLFKPQIFHHEMIYKIIPHEASKNFGIEDMTEQDIETVKDILIAIDNITGNGISL
jgi:hypothetical protein